MVTVGKYNMTPAQKTSLIDSVGISEDNELEPYLDSLEAVQFMKLPQFGMAYVKYVRELRGHHVDPVKDLLDPNADLKEVLAPEYHREPPLFQPLSDGRYDCRITVTLPPHQARWLEGLMVRLPEMYPKNPEMQDLGWHMGQVLLQLMKQDTERHGRMGENAAGTMSASEFRSMRGGAS